MKEYKDYKYLTKAITLPDGRRKYIRAKTKRELDKKVLDFQLKMAQGKVVVENDMTVMQLAEMWLRVVKEPALKGQSYDVYRREVDLHIVPALGEMKVSDVRPVNIYDLINNYGYKGKGSNRKLLSHTRTLFEFAVENKIISESPVPKHIAANGNPTRVEKPLTPNQTAALLDYCRTHDERGLYLFTLLALVTGMRRGEISALRWDCVDFQSSEIKVRRNLISSTGEVTENLKTEAARRDIPIPPDVLALLKQIKAESSSTYVINGDVDGHLVAKDINRFSDAWARAGVSQQTIHPHLFRKTYATRLIETGTDPKRVQYLLGHATLEMTLSVYAMYDQESQKKSTYELICTVYGTVVASVAN